MYIYIYICVCVYVYALNTSNKTWINENDIVEELPFPDMAHRGNQYKFDSEL